MAEKRIIDWDAIERDYRAGIKTLREIAADHNVSHTAVKQRAVKFAWVRNLDDKIKAKADELVSKSTFQKLSKITELEIIETEATTQAMIIIAHRADTNKYRTLGVALYEELAAQTLDKENFDNLGELMRFESKNGVDKLNDLYKRIIDTPSRIDSYKKLGEAFKTIVGLERQAYNISDNANGAADQPDAKPTPAGDFLNDMIKRIAGS